MERYNINASCYFLIFCASLTFFEFSNELLNLYHKLLNFYPKDMAIMMDLAKEARL
jgi:hypothetical protein